MLVRCRTGASLCDAVGSCDAQSSLRWDMAGSGFIWYDTGQAHIVTDSHFYRCGASTGTGGCGDTCLDTSAVWGFLTHADEHVPESMQVHTMYEPLSFTVFHAPCSATAALSTCRGSLLRLS